MNERQTQMVDQNILNYFSNHEGDVITPAEWRKCATMVISSMIKEINEVVDLSADLAQLENKCLVDITNAKNETKQETIKNLITNFESFCQHEELGAGDKPDISGMIRAIEILKKELI